VLVPAGSHEVVLRYRSTWFLAGALISAVSWLIVLAWLYWSFIRPSALRPPNPLPK
jgi:hypothetical protein